MQVDRVPINVFTYSQIPNHDYYMALLHEGKVLHSPVTCKDYFQDIFWSESRRLPCDAHGLKWVPGLYNIDRPTHQLYIHGGKDPLGSHAPNLEAFLNAFSKAQGFPPVVVEKVDKFSIVVSFPREWATSGPLLSAFTSAIRISGDYVVGMDPTNYLNSITAVARKLPHPYMTPEVGRVKVIRPKLKALLAGQTFVLDWNQTSGGSATHNMGIMGWSEFPTIEKEL